ncbi:MAG TPA: DNA-binding protein WhiA [Gaiellaceae bacterium]|nr:DNA-binding protein WhiA [Gaiellaceae bacterium]
MPSRGRGTRHRRVRRRRRRGQEKAARARGGSSLITSEDVREELATIVPARECDRLAELSALFHSAGSLHLRGAGEWALHLDLGSGASARRAFALLRDSGIRSEIRTYRRRAFDRATRYQLHVDGDDAALGVLTAAGVIDHRHAPLERPPRRVVARSCCRAAYLRGAFLGAGSITLGRSPHLELRTASLESAALLARLARAQGSELALADRDTHAVAYAKSWEAIESLLAVMGASETVLALEERAVVAGARERANRLANADHANLVRTSRSARRQLEAVMRLDLDTLPYSLREAAELRLRHPTAPLRELASRADPPATKAAMHRRLRRLEQLAE